MAMCEHFKRKMSLKEFPVLYAFRDIPCEMCDYVFYIPEKYKTTARAIIVIIAVIIGCILTGILAELDPRQSDEGPIFGMIVIGAAVLSYIICKIGGSWVYSMAYDIKIYDE